MAAMVCPGLQPYLDSQLVESRIHRLRFPSSSSSSSSSPKPITPPQPMDLALKSCVWESNNKTNNSNKTDSTVEKGGWSSIQTLNSNVSQGLKESSYGPSYVRLSPKSLELCTENLGNETGTDMIEIDLLPCATTGSNLGTMEGQNRKQRAQVSGAKEFPPPLTTIRGSESLRVRPHREGGRLVLQVTKVSSCFQAQRSHGRLRLCLSTHQQDQHHHAHIQQHLQTHKTNAQTLDLEDHEEQQLDAENEDSCGGGWEEPKVNNGWSIETQSRRRRRRSSRCKEDQLVRMISESDVVVLPLLIRVGRMLPITLIPPCAPTWVNAYVPVPSSHVLTITHTVSEYYHYVKSNSLIWCSFYTNVP
ncbi:hypothetical protein VNO77_41770 [Canavalia gladiata]|uniref:FAF domain-containing protein n=1 Tax=Canavalia gladiata TaxID=3824 RepID=A0AAN9K1G8_CANGL